MPLGPHRYLRNDNLSFLIPLFYLAQLKRSCKVGTEPHKIIVLLLIIFSTHQIFSPYWKSCTNNRSHSCISHATNCGTEFFHPTLYGRPKFTLQHWTLLQSRKICFWAGFFDGNCTRTKCCKILRCFLLDCLYKVIFYWSVSRWSKDIVCGIVAMR